MHVKSEERLSKTRRLDMESVCIGNIINVIALTAFTVILSVSYKPGIIQQRLRKSPVFCSNMGTFDYDFLNQRGGGAYRWKESASKHTRRPRFLLMQDKKEMLRRAGSPECYHVSKSWRSVMWEPCTVRAVWYSICSATINHQLVGYTHRYRDIQRTHALWFPSKPPRRLLMLPLSSHFHFHIDCSLRFRIRLFCLLAC